MKSVRRLSIAALVVACTHLVFGAIVRISGSGMGCGDNWPKCYGHWFPPFNRPDLIVEVSHRYLASILTLTVLSMAFVAFRNRRVEGVAGKGGPMRSAFGAVGAVFTAAILGGVTVKMGNAPWATVAHWLVAMTLLAMVAMTAIRAGALGGASSLVQRGTSRAKRSGFAAAVLAIFAVALGGLTAKYPGAAVGCTTVPMCGANPSVEPAGVHIQLTHRTIAVLLVLHLIGVVMMVRKRRDSEAPVVYRAAHIALGMVLLQLIVASSMILFHLPPVLRSLHEATGVGIWLSCFALAYLARRAANHPDRGEGSVVPAPSSGSTTLASHPERSEGPGLVAAPLSTSPVPSVALASLGLTRDDTRAEEIAPEHAAPAVEVAAQIVEAAVVAIELPAVEVPVTAVEPVEAAPVLAAAAPTVEEPAEIEPAPEPVIEVAAPVLEEAAPILELAAPVIEVAEQIVEAPAPAVTLAAAILEDPAPVFEAATTAIEETASVVDVAMPIAEEADVVEQVSAPEVFDTADLDYSPREMAAVEELDEFSLPPEPKPGFAELEPEPIVEKKEVIEEVVANSSIVTPPAGVAKLSPLPTPRPAPTMAVIVARGADLL